MPTRSSSSIARSRASRLPRPAALAQRLGDLVADREHRVQAGRRVLEDHRDLAAAQRRELGRLEAPSRSSPRQQDLAAEDLARVGHEAQQRAQGDALAAAGLADQADGLPGLDREADAGRPPAAGRAPAGKPIGEVAHLEQRRPARPPVARAHRPPVSVKSVPKRSARPSPIRLKPTPTSTITKPGRVDDPPGGEQHLLALGDHRAPLGRRRRDAEAEVGERRQQEDVEHDVGHREDDVGADHVRQRVAEDDPRRRVAERLRREDELAAGARPASRRGSGGRRAPSRRRTRRCRRRAGPGPTIATIARIRTMNGKATTMSTSRMTTVSTQPPR